MTNLNLIPFPADYQPFPAMLGETPVTVLSATTLYAKVAIPGQSEPVVVTVSRLHR